MNINNIKKINIFYLLFLSLCFHNFYRISFIYVLLPLICYFLIFYNTSWQELRIPTKNIIFILYLLILFSSLYILFISFVRVGPKFTAIGIARYFYVLPITLVVYTVINTEEKIHKLLHLFIIFIAIGSLTLPLQLFTGPISWFSDPTMRSGLTRYSSLFGNVSSMGIVGGVGLIAALLMHYKKKKNKIIIIVSILLGMGMSLQRAGIANIILCSIIYGFYVNINLSKKIFYTTLSVISIFFIGYSLLQFEATQIYMSFFLSSIGVDSGVDVIRDYAPINDQIYYRLFTNVSVHFNERMGWGGFMTGFGYTGLGGVLGQKGDFTHNDFFNMAAVGGVFYLIIYLLLFLFVYILLVKYIKISKTLNYNLMTNNLLVLLGVHLIFVFNIPMGSGNFIHPNISIIFWVTLGLLSGHYYNFFHKPKFYKGSLNAYR